jgi:hypothetical protein
LTIHIIVNHPLFTVTTVGYVEIDIRYLQESIDAIVLALFNQYRESAALLPEAALLECTVSKLGEAILSRSFRINTVADGPRPRPLIWLVCFSKLPPSTSKPSNIITSIHRLSVNAHPPTSRSI